jgi:hypothetical protein
MGDVIRIGADIGQRVDPTAIVVAEEETRRGTVHYLARMIERLPLGTPYPQVADRLAQVAATIRQRAAQEADTLGQHPRHVEMVIDATGVGTPIVDLLRERGESPIAAYFTHGDRYSQQGRQISIGKAWLVSRLQVLFQTGRLHLALTDHASALREELLNYEIRIDDKANDRYGAFKTGTHDDIVTALGLAVGPERQGAVTSYSWLPTGDGEEVAEEMRAHLAAYRR